MKTLIAVLRYYWYATFGGDTAKAIWHSTVGGKDVYLFNNFQAASHQVFLSELEGRHADLKRGKRVHTVTVRGPTPVDVYGASPTRRKWPVEFSLN